MVEVFPLLPKEVQDKEAMASTVYLCILDETV
jgi:hypothetical protein